MYSLMFMFGNIINNVWFTFFMFNLGESVYCIRIFSFRSLFVCNNMVWYLQDRSADYMYALYLQAHMTGMWCKIRALFPGGFDYFKTV